MWQSLGDKKLYPNNVEERHLYEWIYMIAVYLFDVGGFYYISEKGFKKWERRIYRATVVANESFGDLWPRSSAKNEHIRSLKTEIYEHGNYGSEKVLKNNYGSGKKVFATFKHHKRL